MPISRRASILGGAALALTCPALLNAGTKTVHDVRINVFQFGPVEIEIARGDTVRWFNADGIDHSATSTDRDASGNPLFDTGLFGRGEEREIVFPTAGRFEYYCARHPSMKASVIVR